MLRRQRLIALARRGTQVAIGMEGFSPTSVECRVSSVGGKRTWRIPVLRHATRDTRHRLPDFGLWTLDFGLTLPRLMQCHHHPLPPFERGLDRIAEADADFFINNQTIHDRFNSVLLAGIQSDAGTIG